MKKLLGVIVTLVCLNSFADAEFWSMGTFNVRANATAEKNRISGITGLSIQIATFTVGDLNTYRLVVEKDSYPTEQRQKILDAGITPWSIAINDQQLKVTKEGSEEIAVNGMDYFMVLGGFRQEVLADLALSRFESDGIDNLQIEEAMVATAPWYRVLHGPFDAPFDTVLSDLKARGVADAWWVKREPEASVELEVEPVPIALKTPVMEAPEIPASTPRLNPPNTAESYFDYCIKKANALERVVYCKDESFSGLVVAEKTAMSEGRTAMSEGRTAMSERNVMGEGPKSLAEFCAMHASLEEREKYCTD